MGRILFAFYKFHEGGGAAFTKNSFQKRKKHVKTIGPLFNALRPKDFRCFLTLKRDRNTFVLYFNSKAVTTFNTGISRTINCLTNWAEKRAE